MNRPSWARILAAAVALLCASCLFGVTAYADDPDPDPAVVSDDGGSDSDLSLDSGNPATDTDLPEELKEHLDEDDIMGSKVIFLEHGKVVVQNDIEDDPPIRAFSSRSSSPVGIYLNVSSSIGDTLYIPSDYIENAFYIDGSGLLHGLRNSTFQGFIGNYTVRFPAYSSPQYRLSDSPGYTWTDIDIEFVSSPNVEVLGANLPWWSDKYKVLISVATMFFIIRLALRRRN